MGIEALSDISKGGTSAFGGGAAIVEVDDVDLATTSGRYTLIAPFTGSPSGSAGAINVSEENGRVTQKGYFWYPVLLVVQESTRYFNGADWSPWRIDLKSDTLVSVVALKEKWIFGDMIGAVSIDVAAAGYVSATLTGNATITPNGFWLNDGESIKWSLSLSGNYTPTFADTSWPAGPPVYNPAGTLYHFITINLGGNIATIGEVASVPGVTSLTSLTHAGFGLDLSTYTSHPAIEVTLSANVTSVTLPPVSRVGSQKVIDLQFVQDGTGSRTVSGWPGTVTFANGAPFTVSLRPNSVSTLTLVSSNGGNWVAYAEPRSGTMPMLRIPTTQRHIAGAVNGSTLSTIALTAARIFYIPFVPARRMALTALGINVTTLLAGTGTAGIYAADGSATFDYPGTLLASTAQGAFNTGSTGTKTGAINITLEAGVTYFIGLINSSAATVRAIPVAGQQALLGFLDNGTANVFCYYSAGATNVLPSTAGAPLVQAVASLPAVYLI